jgi:hypothetical protein
MKIDGHHEAGPVRPASDKGRFQQELKKAVPRTGGAPPRAEARPPALTGSARRPLTPVASPGLARVAPGVRLASAEYLGQVRQGLHAEAHRLHDVRGEAQLTQREQLHQRVGALIARELAREPPAQARLANPSPGANPREVPSSSSVPEPPAGVSGVSGGLRESVPTTGAPPPAPEARVQATLELIEKLELFVKSQRPALALHLGGSWDARVEVERTGAGEVALRIQGHRGPLPPQELTRIRESLVARGLKISAFLAC